MSTVNPRSFDRLLIIYHLALHSLAFEFMVIMYRVDERTERKIKREGQIDAGDE